MRKGLIAAAIFIVGWFALKDSAFTLFLGEATSLPDVPDYYFENVWLDRPEEAPQGGWEEPWGVDLFVIAPPASSPMRKGLIAADHDAIKSEYEEFAAALGLNDRDITIYAPSYRSPSPASEKRRRDEEIKDAQSDMASAMKRYLSTDNRLRGLVILAAPDTEPLLYAALQQVPESEDFRKRFGGVLVPAGKDETRWDDFIGSCSPAFDSCALATSQSAGTGALSWLTPSLPRPSLNYSADDELTTMIDDRMQSLSTWLDLNAERPAEPFDTWAADEVVDVAPIHRPNQDEDISGERGN